VTRKIPVILFGDYIAAFGVIRALGPEKIPIYLVASKTKHNLCSYSRYVRATTVISHDDPLYFGKFVRWGLKTVGDSAVIIVAGADEPLDILAHHREQLPQGWYPTFPEDCVVKLVRKKHLTYGIANSISVPTPWTFLIRNKIELKTVLRNNKITFPALMKAEDSARFNRKFGTKGVKVNSLKDILRSYEKHDSFFGELLLQEMVEGGNETLLNFIGVYNENSDFLAGFGNQKIRVGKEFSSCTLMSPYFSETVRGLSNKLVKSIGYTGYANSEFKFDHKDGKIKLMEINGRVSMSNSHSLKYKVNLPLVLYLSVVSPDSLKGTIDLFNEPLKKRYLWWSPLEDLKLLLKALRTSRKSTTFYFAQLSSDGLAVEPFSWRDPIPGVFAIAQFTYGILRRLPRNTNRQKV